MVERHVRTGEIIIARQRALIGRLSSSNHSVDTAEDLLRMFESVQCEHLAHLARLTG